MDEKQTAKKQWYQKWWVWSIVAYVLLFIWVKVISRNPASPIVFIIGVPITVFGIWIVRKILKDKERIADDTKRKNKAGIFSLFIIFGGLMVIIGFATLWASPVDKTESVVTNIVFKGIGENTSPLAVSDLKLLKKENTYTIVGTLKKTSIDPTDSYFDFNIILIDDNGKYIQKKQTGTRPKPFDLYHNGNLFTNGSTFHFELPISITSSDKPPVTIEFSDIKEMSKADLIRITIDDAKDNLNKQNYDSAKQYANKVLEYEPDNAEAKTLLEQATVKEQEQKELKAEDAQKTENKTTATPTPAPTQKADSQGANTQEPKWYRAEGFQATIGAKLYYGTGDERMYVGKVIEIRDFKKDETPDGKKLKGMLLEMDGGSVEWKDRMVVYDDPKWSVKAEDLAEDAKKDAIPN